MVEVESHPFEPDTVLFMDWRDDHFDNHPNMKAANQYVTCMLPALVRDMSRLSQSADRLLVVPIVHVIVHEECLHTCIACQRWYRHSVKLVAGPVCMPTGELQLHVSSGWSRDQEHAELLQA